MLAEHQAGAGARIGLTLVEAIVKSHQFAWEVRDDQPQGSIFCLYLPIAS